MITSSLTFAPHSLPPSTVALSPTQPSFTQRPQRLEALLALCDEAAYLVLPELLHPCTAELRRNSNINVQRLSRTSSHALMHIHGPSSTSMRSMVTLRECDEDSADVDVHSTSTGRNSISLAQSQGSAHSHGRSRSTTSATTTAAAAAPPLLPLPLQRPR
jgi:hypothetical protein